MAAVNQVVDETVFRYRTEGVEDTTRKVDGLATAQDGLATANDGATASSERAERRVRTLADAQAIAQRQLEATLRLTEQMDRANGAYGQSVAAAAANENKAAVERAGALAAIGTAFKATAKLALEHPIIVGAATSMSARALSGLAASAATSLASASAATAQYANDNTAMGGKVASAANVASRALGSTSAAASAAAGGFATVADKTSSFTSILFGTVRALSMLRALLGPIALAISIFEVLGDVVRKAYADLERLVALGRQAEKLDVSAPFLKSFTGLGAKVRAETTEMEAALKQASGFVEAQFGGDRLAKLVADIAAQTGGAALRAAQQIDLAQGTEERIRAALAAMVELEARGQQLAALDLGEKVFGATFVERVRRGQISFAQIADDLNGLRNRELVRQEDVTRAVGLAREIEEVKAEISKATDVSFDFSAAAVMIDKAWLGILKIVRDVAVAVDQATRPGDEGAYIRRLQALASEIETVSIPREMGRGNLDVVESLRSRLAGLYDEIDRLSPAMKNAERAIDEAVGRVPPALPAMSAELEEMRVAANQAARGLDGTGASAAAAGAQLAGAAAKAQGFAAALNAIQAANPNLASTVSLMGQIGDIQKQVADGSKAVFEAFDAGKITDPEAQRLVRKLNDDAAESIKALRTEAEKPWKSYAREAELGAMKELPKALAEAGDKYAETRKQAEAYYRVQIDRATPEARGAVEKERAAALAGIDAAFKKIEATTRDNAAERGAKDAAKAAKEAEKEFDDFKSKAEEAFKKLFPADALRKQGQEFQKELDKYRDKLNAEDPRLVTAMEARIKLNLDGKEVEGVKEQTDELAKEMAGAFRGVFDEMFSSANKGFAGLLDGFTKSLSRIGTRLLESTFLTPLFSGKDSAAGAGLGGLNLGSFDFDKLSKAVGEGSFDGIMASFGDLLKPGAGGGKGTGFASTKLGGGLMSAGVGAAIGYQSQSPLVGALGGAASGFAMGGPVGGVVGGIAGLVGGLLGKNEARKAARKKIEEQLKAYREAYDQAKPEIEKLRATFRGESLGSVGVQIDQAFQQAVTANKTASQAGDQKTADQIMVEFTQYAFRLRDVFMHAFEGTLSEVAAGFGTSGPFAQANAAVASLGETLKAFVTDAEKLPQPEINGPRARAAAQQAALSALTPPKALSDMQQRLAAIQGTAAGLGRVLQDLGMSADAAAAAIRDRTAVAMKALRDEFSADLKGRTNEALGKGYLNEAANLVRERDTLMADAKAIGASTDDVTAYFRAAAQKLVDDSQLTGDAFAALVKRFPALKGAVVEFGQAVDSVAAKAEAAARATGYQDRAFAADTDTSTLGGALAAQERKAAADRLAEQKAGGQKMAELEAALGAEQAAIRRQFAEQAAAAEAAAREAGQRRILTAENRLFAARNDNTTLAGKLAELDRQHAQERLEEADADGRAMTQLLEAQAAERLKIVREAGAAEIAARKAALAEAQTFLDGATKNIRTYLDGLKAGPETNLSPGDRLKAAQAQFDAQMKLARGGDRNALSSITTYADRLLDAGKGQYASGKGYQDILGSVTKQLGALPKQVSAEQFIVDAIKDQTTALQTAIGTGSAGEIAAALKGSFDRLDTNTNGLLSQAEFLKALGPKATVAEQQAALAVFRAIDLNGDGQLSKLELARYQLKAAIEANSPAFIQRALSADFGKLDTNLDGLLTPAEFLAGLGPLATAAEQAAAMEWFKAIDANGDGLLSKTELMRGQLLTALQVQTPQAMATALRGNFDRLDANTNGLLSTKEYLAGLGPLASKAEQQAALAVFRAIDLDGDGQISKLEALRSALGSNLAGIDAVSKAVNDNFGRLDRNGSGGLSLTEFKAAFGPLATKADQKLAEAYFKNIDADGDGIISRVELARVDLLAGLKANDPGKMGAAIAASFKTIDLNADAKIDWSEYVKAVGPATKAEQAAAKAVFDRIDADGDGFISKAEAVRADLLAQLKANDPGKMGAAIAASFKTIDLNADAKIDWNEYVKAVGPATKAEQAAAKAVFDRIDADGNGVITAIEAANSAIAGAVKANSASAFAAALNTNFSTLDKSVNGILDKAELQDAIKGLSTAAEQRIATDWIKALDANGDGQLTQAELTAGRLFDLKGLVGGTTAAVKDGKTATDAATGAVKDGNGTAAASKALLDSLKGFAADQKTILTTIQGYQNTAKDTLTSLKTSGGLQEEQLRLLNKQFTLASPVRVSGTSTVLNNGMIDALNKIVFNTGQTVSGLIKLMSTNRPDGLLYAFAEGGPIRGPGTGTSDSIPIWASNGEFMMRAAAAQAIGLPTLQAMNDNPGMVPAVPMPIPVAGGGMDVGALLTEQRATRDELRSLRADNKALLEMLARVTKAGADKVAGKVEETTDEVAASREDARREAAPKRAGRGEPIKRTA